MVAEASRSVESMNGFKLEGLLKTGGQGEVWRATHDSHGEVAVKVLQVARGIDGEQATRELKRFLREIDTQSVLNHNGIVAVLDHGEADGRPWYAMRLAEGSLRDLLVMNPGGMPEDQSIVLFADVLEAVVFAHREGAIHRDIKPENILLYGDNEPALSDFGLVRRLHSGSSTITVADGLGSMKYAAPEQLEDGHVVDERADIYSLGCVLFEMLTGRPFFPHRSLQLAPTRFRALIHRATELDQAGRYSSSAEMFRAFKMVAQDVDKMHSPSSRADALIVPISSGKYEATDIAALAQILVEHSDDSHLYLGILGRSPEVVVMQLAGREESAFKEIVKSFSILARGVNLDWDHVDEVGRFLVSATKATEDVESRIILLRTLLDLAQSHNRFRVRTMWINIAHEVMVDPTYAPIVASLVRDMPHCKEFLLGEIQLASLPAMVAEELAA